MGPSGRPALMEVWRLTGSRRNGAEFEPGSMTVLIYTHEDVELFQEV